MVPAITPGGMEVTDQGSVMALFNKREQLIIGFLILTALVLAAVRYVRVREDIGLYRRGEVLRVIDNAPPR
jgi:hypothetical protein